MPGSPDRTCSYIINNHDDDDNDYDHDHDDNKEEGDDDAGYQVCQGGTVRQLKPTKPNLTSS